MIRHRYMMEQGSARGAPPCMAPNVWRGHAVTRPDLYNERVLYLLMTRTIPGEGRGMERELYLMTTSLHLGLYRWSSVVAPPVSCSARRPNAPVGISFLAHLPVGSSLSLINVSTLFVTAFHVGRAWGTPTSPQLLTIKFFTQIIRRETTQARTCGDDHSQTLPSQAGVLHPTLSVPLRTHTLSIFVPRGRRALQLTSGGATP